MPTSGDVMLGHAGNMPKQGSVLSASLRRRCALSSSACVVNRGVAPFDIIAVNSNWSWLCGYSAQEALGKTPALLHGPGTDKIKARSFTSTLESGAGMANMTLINYSKGGTPFVHRIHSEKVKDENGETFFVTESAEEDDPSVMKAVFRKAGISIADRMRSDAAGMFRAFLVALLLIIAFFAIANATASSSIESREKPAVYDGFIINDPYFFSVFDHGLPLVG